MNEPITRRSADVAWLAVAGAVLLGPSAIGWFGSGINVLADPWSTPKLLVLALAACVGSAALAVGVLRGREALRFNRRYLWAVGFLGVAAVTTIAGVDRWQALLGSDDRQGLLTMVLCVATGLVAMHVVRSPERMRRLQLLAVAGGVPVSLVALSQVAGVPALTADLPGWMAARGVGTIGNPDMLGGYLVWPLVLAAAFALSEAKPLLKWLAWVACGLSAIALFATLGRGAWIGGVVGLVTLALAAGRLRLKPARADKMGPAVAGGALVLAALALARQALPRLGEMFSAEGLAASGRMQLWEVGLRAIPDHWLLGVGPDSFVYAYMSLRPMEYAGLGGAATVAYDAHNYLIMLAVTVGLPGLLFALAFLVAVLVQAGKVAFGEGGGPGRLSYAGWLAALVGYCGYLFFGPGSVAPNTLLWVAFGVLLSPRASVAEGSAKRLGSTIVAATAVCAAVGLALTLAITASSVQLARSEATTGEAALAHAVKATEIMPWLRESRLRVAEVAGSLAVNAAGSRAASAPSAVSRAAEAYEALFAVAPLEYEGRVMYANVLLSLSDVRSGAADEALAVAREAKEIFPAGLHARAAEGAALIALGRPEDAAEALADVWDLDPTYPEPGAWYAYALQLSGRGDEARQVVSELEESFPTDVRVEWVASQVR